jgi:NDP-sugar pyrophosphorylase family protein
MKAFDLYTLPQSLTEFARYFPPDIAPWEWLRAISRALKDSHFDPSTSAIPAGVKISGSVFIHPSVELPHFCHIEGPAWIGAETKIRPGAYVRGDVIVGKGCVLGNSCEFKNSLLMDGVQVPHFSYVGDSILGNNAHLGAGVICSNLRLDQKPVKVRFPNGSTVNTNLRKFGALLGDRAEVGCNSVLQPGTILGKRSLVHPLTAFSGILPENMIAKAHQSCVVSVRPRD